MRIDFNINQLGQPNQSLHVNRINQKAAQQANPSVRVENQDGRRDRVTISRTGKASSLMEALIKQKQRVQDSKNELLANTLDQGGEKSQIQNQLDLYDEQIKNIDDQIAQAAAEQAKGTTEDKDKENTAASYQPKTPEEAAAKEMSDLLDLSSALSRTEEISMLKEHTEGQVNVVKGEIKLDQSRGSVSEGKLEKLTELESKARELNNQLGESIGDLTEDLGNVREEDTIVEETGNDSENTEKITDETVALESQDSIRKQDEDIIQNQLFNPLSTE